jgi:hypothetical protein
MVQLYTGCHLIVSEMHTEESSRIAVALLRHPGFPRLRGIYRFFGRGVRDLVPNKYGPCRTLSMHKRL